MPLFRRRPAESTEPDEDLPFLTVPRAERLRAVVARAFAERGLEVAVQGGHVEDADGRQFGLWNVAAQCAGERERAWPGLVAQHVDRVLASLDGPDPFDELSEDELRARVVVRLYEQDALPSPDAWPHAAFAPGVVQALALDLPETVALLTHEQVARLGGWQALHPVGLRNLAAEPVDAVERVPAPGDASFTVVLGDSVHTASRALLLPGLLAELGEPADAPDGWLLAVPHRHQLVLHVLRDASVIGALNGMARFAALGAGDGAGVISPHVYWWSGDDYRQLTRHDDDGTVSVHVDPDLGEVLERLVAR